MLKNILMWLVRGGLFFMPILSFGQWVGFTKSIDPGFAWTIPAQGNIVLGNELAQLIDNATASVDFCFYDIEFPAVVTSLINAQQRGITVRVITDNALYSNPEILELENAGIPVIDDAFGDLNSGGGEMHNKFAVMDQAIIWTGSYNVTIYGTYSNANNGLWLENVGLASAYTTEFNEMWGSTTTTPNPATARFHGAKTDNTTHQFYQNNNSWQLYFAPSDGLTSRIIQAINTADYEIYFSIFAFSTASIADAIHQKMLSNPDFVVKGVFEETYWNTSWSMSLPMRGDGENGWDPPADVYKDSVEADLGLKRLHHKYMIIDGQHPGSNPKVITGSMNWSDNGESLNDENLLIIDDPNIANAYVQEFVARLEEAGGTLEFIPQGLMIEPPVVDFRNVNYNESAQVPFTLKNLSAAGIQISLGNFTGPDNAITISDSYNGTLAAGDSTSLTAQFNPAYLGQHVALAPIYLDGESSPSRYLTLQGRGVSDQPTPVVINEFMSNPEAVYDNNGEWLELYNPTGPPVKLNDWRVIDLDGDYHHIEASETMVLPTYGFFVLGNNGDFATNGGVNLDYTWSGYNLANTDDEIILHNDLGETVDSVAYLAGWPLMSGRSTSLISSSADNSIAGNWFSASTVFGMGDKGTPGALNENEVGLASENRPVGFQLADPYPNPFNGSIILPVWMGQQTEIEIFNLRGQAVWRTRLTGDSEQSFITWSPQTLAGGLYFARIKSDESLKTFKITYLK